jgi:hypothetical protein
MQRMHSQQLTISVMPKDQMSADVVYLQCRQQREEHKNFNSSHCVQAAHTKLDSSVPAVHSSEMSEEQE